MNIEKTVTNLDDFLGELASGNFKDKIAKALSDTALKVSTQSDGKKKGKVTVEFNISKVGEGEQVIIQHKLAYQMPTARGKRSEEDTTETPMFVGKYGVMTVNAPKYDQEDHAKLRVASSN